MAAARATSEPFSAVDAAWLHMDAPTNMAMITGVLMFDEPLDLDRLKATLEARFLRYPRFRQRVSEPSLRLGAPRWENDPTFDLNAHLHRVALPAPGDHAALQELASDFMGTPLDFTKPLWQMHYVEGYGAGAALIVRLHHCIADGLALVQVLLSTADDTANAPWPEPFEEPSRRAIPMERLLAPVMSAYQKAGRAAQQTEELLRDGFGLLKDRTRLVEAVKIGVGGGLALSKLLLTPPDRKTIFRGRCGVAKRAVWSDPIPLDHVKAIGKALDGTVNDVLLTAVSGALERYLARHRQPTDGVNIRAMVPVSVRPPEEMGKLGNRFGLVILSLPVGIHDPVKRLAVLKRRMDSIKGSPEAVIAFGILNTMGLTPQLVEDIVVGIFAAKVTAVMTNVPGPSKPVYLAGTPVRGVMFWVPSPGNLAIGISIISYRGEVLIGVATDAGIIPQPEEIVTDFHAELRAMAENLLNAKAETKPVPAGRCQALTKSGQPCKNRALSGGTTCQVHGG